MQSKRKTMLHKCYGDLNISERHRHRYEFNNDFREQMIENGLTIAGTSPDGKLVEAVEVEKINSMLEFNIIQNSRVDQIGRIQYLKDL